MNEQYINTKTVAVVGGGTMGTALAQLLSNNDLQVKMWVYEEELVGQINDQHRNDLFLPGVTLSPNITATSCTFVSRCRSLNSTSRPLRVMTNVLFSTSPLPQHTPQNVLFLWSPSRPARPCSGTVSLI